MAQTHSDHAARSGGGGGAFQLMQPLIVQLGFSEETPEGGVVQMAPGWYTKDNLDPRLADHPIIMRLMPQDPASAARLEARAELVRKMSTGAAQPGDMQKLLAEQAKEEAEAHKAAVEAWNQKAQDAADKGMPFNDMHPDPQVNFAKAMTGGTPQFVASGALMSKIGDVETVVRPTRPAVRPAPTPERD